MPTRRNESVPLFTLSEFETEYVPKENLLAELMIVLDEVNYKNHKDVDGTFDLIDKVLISSVVEEPPAPAEGKDYQGLATVIGLAFDEAAGKIFYKGAISGTQGVEYLEIESIPIDHAEKLIGTKIFFQGDRILNSEDDESESGIDNYISVRELMIWAAGPEAIIIQEEIELPEEDEKKKKEEAEKIAREKAEKEESLAWLETPEGKESLRKPTTYSVITTGKYDEQPQLTPEQRSSGWPTGERGKLKPLPPRPESTLTFAEIAKLEMDRYKQRYAWTQLKAGKGKKVEEEKEEKVEEVEEEDEIEKHKRETAEFKKREKKMRSGELEENPAAIKPLKREDFLEALAGEGWAINDYADMIARARTQKQKKVLSHIQKEEMEHLDDLSDLIEV